jgi:hypothetical protein
MGLLMNIKCVDSRVNVHILASTSVPFTLTTVQVPNLALTNKKRITVHASYNSQLAKEAPPRLMETEGWCRNVKGWEYNCVQA